MVTTATSQRWRSTPSPTSTWSLMTPGLCTRVTWQTIVRRMSSPSLAVEVELVLMVSMARHQSYMQCTPMMCFCSSLCMCTHVMYMKMNFLLDPTFSGVCHSRERIGYTMSSYAVTGRGHVGALTDCSQECQKDSSCNSFSFR